MVHIGNTKRIHANIYTHTHSIFAKSSMFGSYYHFAICEKKNYTAQDRSYFNPLLTLLNSITMPSAYTRIYVYGLVFALQNCNKYTKWKTMPYFCSENFLRILRIWNKWSLPHTCTHFMYDLLCDFITFSYV